MKIDTVKIDNWRSINQLSIKFQNLSVVIGQNNHGKSNILSALLFFFGKIKPNQQDFLNSENPSKIELKFIDLDENDRRTFRKYLNNDNSITVRKTLSTDLKFIYQGFTQLPTEDWLNPANINTYTNRETVSSTPLIDIIPATGRLTKSIIEDAQTRYINDNSDTLEFNYILEESNFLGLKNVAQGIFGDVFFIPAVKNASDELNPKKPSVFNELYSKILNKLTETNETYKSAKNQVNQLVGTLNKKTENGDNNNSRPEELNTFENNIATELGNWNTSIEVEITPPNIDDIFKVGTNIWINDGVKTDVDRKGNGLQRALIFALIKSYSNILPEENNNNSENGESNRQVSNSSYFIIEEPELYLHPQAQRDLYSTLKNLSENNNQVVLTTHSNSFVDIENYNSLIITQKENVTVGTTVKQCTSDLFSEIQDRQKINLIYWINPERSELFYAKKIILLEGQTEKTVIPFLAKRLEIFKNEYTLIDCGSKSSIPLYLRLLNGFKLNYTVVYDRDHQEYKTVDAIATADSSSRSIENSINSEFGNSVVFENDIEEEIGIIERRNKSKPYQALVSISDEHFEISPELETKLRLIYD